MQIVIEIPEEEYRCVQITGCIGNNTCISNAIYNGVLLPKGHGRLKDIDRFESHDEYDGQGFTKSVYKDDIDNAPTIIEADKENDNADID